MLITEKKNSTNVFTLVEGMKKLDHKPCNNAKTALAEQFVIVTNLVKQRDHKRSTVLN